MFNEHELVFFSDSEEKYLVKQFQKMGAKK